MAYKLKFDYEFYYESFDSDIKYLQHISNLESAKDLTTKLEYFNKNICSLSIYDIDGKVYYEYGFGGKEIKIYCGCENCKKADLFNAEEEKIYLNIRDKELKRIAKNVNQKSTYKEKVKYLLTVLGYRFDKLDIYENDKTELLNLTPKTKAQIIDFNELITDAFNKKYITENGFTENYKCFRFDVEKERLDKALQNAADPHLLVDKLIKQIEIHYGYPEPIVEKPLPNQKHIDEIDNQLKQLGFAAQKVNFFNQWAYGLDVDLNENELDFPTLKRYHCTKEIFKFYTYWRGWKANEIKNVDEKLQPKNSLNQSTEKPQEIKQVGNIKFVKPIRKDTYLLMYAEDVEIMNFYEDCLKKVNPKLTLNTGLKELHKLFSIIEKWERILNERLINAPNKMVATKLFKKELLVIIDYNESEKDIENNKGKYWNRYSKIAYELYAKGLINVTLQGLGYLVLVNQCINKDGIDFIEQITNVFDVKKVIISLAEGAALAEYLLSEKPTQQMANNKTKLDFTKDKLETIILRLANLNGYDKPTTFLDELLNDVKQFNTLGQIGTNKCDNDVIIIKGNGSDLSDKDVLKGRAKRKLITQKTVLSLIDVAKNNGEDERIKSYWNTYRCQNKLYTVDEKLFAKYCKNRFCTLCCSIRKAELINKYFPLIQQWQEPYFVTLTLKAFDLTIVRKAMIKILKCFNMIIAKHKKRHQRGMGTNLIGIRALESNFNPRTKTYNPHLHLIVANKEMADIIVAEWQERFGTTYVSHKGQNIKRIEDKEKQLIELIKYGTKIFTEPDVKKKGKSTGNEQIYVAALNNIYKAMKGLRIFERFGFNLPKETLQEKPNARVVKHFSEWDYDPKQFDWINSKNDKRLTDYKPEAKLIDLLETRINTKLE